jgi:hypothetical protein
LGNLAHILHVWDIYLQTWVIFRADVGKYSTYGAYGLGTPVFLEENVE